MIRFTRKEQAALRRAAEACESPPEDYQSDFSCDQVWWHCGQDAQMREQYAGEMGVHAYIPEPFEFASFDERQLARSLAILLFLEANR